VQNLTPEGLRIVTDVATRHPVSLDAATPCSARSRKEMGDIRSSITLISVACAIKHAAYSRHIIAWVGRITTACPDKLRTSQRNPLGHRAAAHQCPQDIRCNIERECSCSGRM
jgi:hypothetical protein